MLPLLFKFRLSNAEGLFEIEVNRNYAKVPNHAPPWQSRLYRIRDLPACLPDLACLLILFASPPHLLSHHHPPQNARALYFGQPLTLEATYSSSTSFSFYSSSSSSTSSSSSPCENWITNLNYDLMQISERIASNLKSVKINFETFNEIFITNLIKRCRKFYIISKTILQNYQKALVAVLQKLINFSVSYTHKLLSTSWKCWQIRSCTEKFLLSVKSSTLEIQREREKSLK